MEMKRVKIKRFLRVAGLLMTFAVLYLGQRDVIAATSYTNPKEFYESTGEYGYHMEIVGGDIYYGTMAKTASPSSDLRYEEVGYDINLSGNGASIDLAVKRGGTLQNVAEVGDDNGYTYTLYKVAVKDLFQLAKDKAGADAVLSSRTIKVVMNSIVTTKKDGNRNGDVAEDGSGNLVQWGAVYHVKNGADLTSLKSIFSGHTFESFQNIVGYLYNYSLTVRYNLQGGSVGNGFSCVEDVLFRNGRPVENTASLVGEIKLADTAALQLEKAGYHMDYAREWNYGNRSFSSHRAYNPKEIEPSVAFGDQKVTVYAHWQPNAYAVHYDLQSGSGLIPNQKFIYDTEQAIQPLTGSRRGYTFRCWNTEPDGSGVNYAPGQAVKNLTDEDGAIFVLYAVWEPNIYAIAADKWGGSGGTDLFYEKYGHGWSSDSKGLDSIGNIQTPGRKGYEFLGFYAGVFGLGAQATGADGKIVMPPDYYLNDSRVYANWKPKVYTITFDKQGGSGGADRGEVSFGAELPVVNSPVRIGYRFLGYFTEPQGKGTMYYNEFMAGMKRWDIDADTTLYACWVDDIAPDVELTASINIWTNREILLTAEAFDNGVGLSSITLYQGDVKVAEVTGLAGKRRETLSVVNPTEGVLNYRAVAEDVNGNVKEVWKSVYYDVTAPKGEVLSESYDGNHLSLEVFVTDYHVQ